MDTSRPEPRQWSWARTLDDVAERRRHIEPLIGARLTTVRYYLCDDRWERSPESVGAGPIFGDDPEPPWRCDGFDSLDYGFELETDSGLIYSLTWDPPGDREGIGLRRTPMLGSGVRADADITIWRGGEIWPLGVPFTDIRLHYEPYPPGFRCPRITFQWPDRKLEVILGESAGGVLAPSADNVAVLHPDTELPG
ncbi:hypothetical protein [Nocardia arthritidis]|uniref:Uncharacterized protein n=1 Tax=Nocardia arthritidis TaxID=228602 RepID=A0A6G9YB27_9NOCA|nr:hypothetical protein [Nocardia arthritidis]QIS10330.1 hypothetical protein F5544_12195 [Nocardia arthritidis]